MNLNGTFISLIDIIEAFTAIWFHQFERNREIILKSYKDRTVVPLTLHPISASSNI